MRQIWKAKWLILAAVILIALFISSAMTYHDQTQVPMLERLLKHQPGRQWLAGIQLNYGGGEVISLKTVGYFRMVEFFIRKLAHFGSYFILGGALFMGLAPYIPSANVRLWTCPLMAGGFAALDEWHQLFTGDRSPMVQDVILDMTGAMTAVIIAFIAVKIWSRRRQ